MEGDDENKDEYPTGFRFKPKDVELVEFYLLPRLKHRPTVPNDCVIDYNVYTCHPDTLTQEHKSGNDQDEWFFLSPRHRMYANGDRPARKTHDGRGRWKASTATKEVAQKVVCNGVTFCRSVLNYFEGVPKNEVRTKWIMLELSVPEYEIKLQKGGPTNMLLDEYVMCKIYVSPQHKKKDDADEEGTSSASACQDGEEEPCSPTDHAQGTADAMLSDKQAGKRPIVAQARRGNQCIASTQASCFSSTSHSPGARVYYGVPGQATGAHNAQAPQMQRQAAGAYNGRRLVRQPTPTPALYQPFSAVRGHPFGQTAAMATTTRPPAQQNPGFLGNPPRGHPRAAFRPQVSLQCFYDHNYRGVRPPVSNASSSSQPQMMAAPFLPQPPPHQPFFNADAYRRAAAAGTGGTPCNSYPYHRSSGHGGAANGGSGAARFNVNAEQYFVDLAMINSSLTGARTQTAPAPSTARPLESPATTAAGAVEVETETDEMSGLDKKDVA